ncbi:T9SS type A sorting domain-containing protein [Flavobacterium enshiense]|uniref:DUF7619 domain-containing protein n=1 Tax=Flavobacterium enshiense TaxID=1341165 RepID=UPI00345CDE68
MKTKLLFLLLAVTTFCSAQIINFPDANFKAALVSSTWQNGGIARNSIGSNMTVDTNQDGEIQVSEAQQVYGLSINFNNSNNITSIVGVNYFSNLTKIYCESVNLSTFTLNGLPNLEEVYFVQCNLTSFTITNCPSITLMNFNYNPFTSLDFSSFPQLNTISCKNNALTNLVVSGLSNLTYLDCSYNQLTSLNVQGLSSINGLTCNNNQLTSLNLNGLQTLSYIQALANQLSAVTFEGCSNLGTAYLSNNQLTFLDLNQCTSLTEIQLSGNPALSGILVKNGRTETVSGLPATLNYICCDEFEINDYRNYHSTPEINTYCSFTPGGNYFTINGTNKLDGNSNGCSASDPNYPNFRINFTDGTTSSTLIPDNSGLYSIPVGTGSFTLTPILDNPSYYTVSPATTTVSFPAASSPATRNFCISPNGIHHDVEISIIPVTRATPGFDATYKLIIKNKGNQIENGTVSFTNYNENVTDYVSSNPAFNSQNTVSNETTYVWNFTNLQQFETKEIEIVLNLNTPTENPPLNMGSILHYAASVTVPSDEAPNDNLATLYQTVVNSYDPNDKTCLEGAVITPDMVGKEVHYLIRFENNGTANAQNIVVKDMIDTAKFDINTLVPIKGSHTFETKISNGNKVEFIFKNINLPFDNANNDGYVLFKIKTKSNLVVGNTFSNSANIYFDYNYPIVTNNYTTTVQNTLGLQENELLNSITVYPNPVKDMLYFKTVNTISKIEIYDVSGRILSSNSVSENKTDVSELKTGNYILKIFTEKGITNTKLIKK